MGKCWEKLQGAIYGKYITIIIPQPFSCHWPILSLKCCHYFNSGRQGMASQVSFILISAGEMKRSQRYWGAHLSAWWVTHTPCPTKAPSLLPCGNLWNQRRHDSRRSCTAILTQTIPVRDGDSVVPRTIRPAPVFSNSYYPTWSDMNHREHSVLQHLSVNGLNPTAAKRTEVSKHLSPTFLEWDNMPEPRKSQFPVRGPSANSPGCLSAQEATSYC